MELQKHYKTDHQLPNKFCLLNTDGKKEIYHSNNTSIITSDF